MNGADALRALLRADQITHVPGIYDPVTAALAVRAGHRVVHLSGAAVSALMLGRPDLGFVGATQIADRASTLAPALRGVPLIADADTGYGSPSHAVWTGHAYVRAGISGLYLVDQVSQVVEIGLAAAKIKALVTQVPDLALIAQTDAYAVSGLPGVIARCRAFAEAGADAIVPEGVTDPAELGRLHAAVPGVPIVINRSESGGSPAPATDADLAAAGVRMVLHPVSALLAALRAASLVYRQIADTGSAEPVDRMPWAAFTEMTGGPEALGADPGAGGSADYTAPSEEIGPFAAGNFHGYTPPGPSGGSAPPGHHHAEAPPSRARDRRSIERLDT